MDEDTFAQVQRLADNKRFATRVSKVSPLLRGLAVCAACGYEVSTARKGVSGWVQLTTSAAFRISRATTSGYPCLYRRACHEGTDGIGHPGLVTLYYLGAH